MGPELADYERVEPYPSVQEEASLHAPAEAQGYSISGRSPLEWIIDRYHVKTDKASGILNDPNGFLREQGRPDAVVDLIKRLVTVSMRTQELLETLPKLEIPEVQS